MLMQSFRLLSRGYHPASISDAWREACTVVVATMLSNESFGCRSSVISLDTTDEASDGESLLRQLVQSTIATKYIARFGTLLSRIATDAVLRVYRGVGGTVRHGSFSMSSFLRVFCVAGGSVEDSLLLPHGLVLHAERASSTSLTLNEPSRVLVISFTLAAGSKSAAKMAVRITDPRAFAQRDSQEDAAAANLVRLVRQAGANLVLCTRHIHPKFVAQFDMNGIVAYQNVHVSEMAAEAP
jgi:chaperonin GroEL (HSP60 family)